MAGPLKYGVVGVGHLGKQHARVVASLSGATLVGLHDTDPGTLHRVASELGVRPFATLAELVSSVQAVSIAVPTTSHFEVAMQCVASGVHVLIEKPLTATVGQAEELVRAAAARPVVLQTGHVERFNPIVRASLSLIKDPKFIEGHRLSSFVGRSTDIDVVLDLMIHDIDLSLAAVQSPVRAVEGTGVPILSRNIDIANARITFENGAVANLTASRVSKDKTRKIRFFCHDSYVSIDCLTRKAELYRKGLPAPAREGEGEGTWEETVIAPGILRRVIVAAPKEEPLRLELEHFVKCVASGATPVVDGVAGLKAMEVAFKVIDKINDGLGGLAGGA
ncbi:MAG: Gfo/Idh/MocA family oxidoreductase [Candidatus Eisenbacteria bacterium]|nr:Gfo/Idh/MocA family oxidoreductase [Candidatus Eisenbacteria bacterium]